MKEVTKNELLSSKEYWMVNIQGDLFGIIEKYMLENKLTKSDLAKKTGVSKRSIDQVFSGEFDHKISTLVKLALACNAMPVLNFVNQEKFLENDANEKIYELISVNRPVEETYVVESNQYVTNVNEPNFNTDFLDLKPVNLNPAAQA